MKHLLLFTTICTLWTMTAIAQVNLSWMKVNRGNYTGASDEAKAVALDKSGNVYTTGYVNNTTTLQDIYTMKRTAAGDSVWARTYTTAGGGYDQPFDMALDDSACAIVCGDVGGQFSVIKYGSDGNFRWIKKMTNGYYAQCVCVDTNRYIYATGVAGGTGDDILIVKLTPLGDTVWTYKYNGTGNGDDRPHGIAIDKNQNCFVVGESYGGTTNTDMVTIKIQSNGTLGWVQRYNGASNGHDYGYAISTDTSGNVYICGEAYSYGYGQSNCIVSYNSAGSQRYAKIYGESSVQVNGFKALAIDAKQNIYVTGRLGHAFYTMKMLPNSTGDTVWARNYTFPGTVYTINLMGSRSVPQDKFM